MVHPHAGMREDEVTDWRRELQLGKLQRYETQRKCRDFIKYRTTISVVLKMQMEM